MAKKPMPWLVMLSYRYHGAYRVVAHTYLSGGLELVTWVPAPPRDRVPVVNEVALVRHLPLPLLGYATGTVLRDILLLAEDEGGGSTAVSEPVIFRPWAKYFPAYAVELARRALPKGKRIKMGDVMQGGPHVYGG